jgi:hypothetical protein
MNLYKETTQIIEALVGQEYLYFDEALQVKQTPHSEHFKAWGVCVSPIGVIYLMTADQRWHELEDKKETRYILSTLYQRVKILQADLKKEEVVKRSLHWLLPAPT